MKAWFTASACSTPRDIKAASISLWYAYAVDILTDLLSQYSPSRHQAATDKVPVMILPLDLIWKLEISLTQKLSVGALFCLGFVCIAVATIRVKELGSTVKNSQPSTTWLALWGIAESSIGSVFPCFHIQFTALIMFQPS